MTKKELTTYTPEFRAEAVKLVLEQGLSLESAAGRLAVHKGALSNWMMAAKRGAGTSTAVPGSRSVAELEAEIGRLLFESLPMEPNQTG